MVNTLIVSGSPRRNGDSMSLVNEMVKYIDGNVKLIHAYYADIAPCNDCRYCWQNDGCAIEDEMQEVYELLAKVDNFIIASPLYFSELSGPLLSFASRLQCLYAQRVIRKKGDLGLREKNGVLVLAGGGDGRYGPAVDRVRILFRHTNTNLIGTVLSLKTNDLPAIRDLQALGEARRLAERLNELNGAL